MPNQQQPRASSEPSLPEVERIPLRAVVGSAHDGYGSFWDNLECGHKVNVTRERPAKRRQCAFCALAEMHASDNGQAS